MFSKEKIKGIVIGAVGSTLLTATVFATPVAKNAQLFFNNIKIFVDDVSVTPKDAQGNVVEPFIYNGTTYLPVRAVSNALGKNVEWDGKTSSVYIGKHNNANKDGQTSSMWLDQLDYFNYQRGGSSDSWVLWESSKDNDSTGASYSHGIKYGMPYYYSKNWQYTEYLLNQKYKKLTGKFVLHYDSRSVNRETYLKIYGDDKLLYTSEAMKSGKMPLDVNVDITGVIKLKVMIDQPGESGSSDTYCGFVDALLAE
jgi:hypothetical protein